MNKFDLLDEKLRKVIDTHNFERPTPVQEAAIPVILEGFNSLIVAPTGTGKTEAALLPVFSNYFDGETTDKGIKIVYVAPLRALNRDILERLQRWQELLDMDIQVRHGDTSQYHRRKQALNPPDMLITTPETLQAILPGSRMKEHLKTVKWVIVDEVHELAESKRGIQLSVGLERVERLAGEFQRIGLSATVGSEKEVAGFLAGPDREIKTINTTSRESLSVGVEAPMPTEKDAELSEELNAEPTMIARIRRIRKLIDEHESVLTFVNTRETSETLGSRLKFWDSNYPVKVHHGSLSKEFRISAEKEFKEGDLKSLICTSSMELGIDVGKTDFIIQYNSPRQVKRLIQRLGRSGHKIEKTSKGSIIASTPDDALESGIIAKDALSQKLEPSKIHENALDVLAHQIVGLNLDGVREVPELFNIVKKSYPFRDLSKDKFIEVLRQLLNEGLIWRDKNKLGRGRRTWKYYYTNLSMIPDIKQYSIKDIVSGGTIGVLDEEFVVGQADPGVTFICKGEAWRVLEIEEDQVKVEPINDPYGAIPAWEGELIPVPFEIAQKVAANISKLGKFFEGGEADNTIVNRLNEELPIEKEASEWITRYVRNHFEQAPLPGKDRLLIEEYGKFAVLHVPFGTILNKTLKIILSALISTRIGTTIGVKSDPYRIAFRFPRADDVEKLEETIRELKPDYIEPLAEKVVTKTSLFRWRLLHVAKRSGAIDKNADFSEIGSKRILETFEDTPIWEETEREIRLEKLDIEKLVDVIKSIEKGDIEIKSFSRGKKQGPTPLGLKILNELASVGELVVPERSERQIIKVLKRRIRNKQIRLLCMNCRDWTKLTRVRRLSKNPKCGNCEAKFLAVTPIRVKGTLKTLKKEGSDDLSKDELRRIDTLKKSGNLVLTYGKKAITAMAGRGIGPTTAARILRKQKSGDDFFKEILHAERTYARTHRFWD